MENMWASPLNLMLIATDDADSWRNMPNGATGVPVGHHPGAFGVQRTHHIHEGVDLYASEGSNVHAVEAGEIVAVMPFTGPRAGLPWWLDTECVLIEGKSGVVVYGEIETTGFMIVGRKVSIGEHLGYVKRVLKNDKGRPTSMLHLELHTHGTRTCPEWIDSRPPTLLDPTPQLIPICSKA